MKEDKLKESLKQPKSFHPAVGEEPRVLVLGTLPGKESLRLNQYYAHSRNLFWRLVFEYYGVESTFNYDIKLDLLKANGIALWDVCAQAQRATSLDSDIKSEIPNPIDEFLQEYPSIKIIAFNGQKAEKLFFKYFTKKEEIKYVTLLSTSPANASYSFEEKMKQWEQIFNI
jgi:hypoxanthine-DNA glycosylase